MNPIVFASSCLIICVRWFASVTSWGRTYKRNSFVKGVAGSHHLDWLGMDVILDDQKKDIDFEKDCAKIGLQALYEGDHYHLQPR